MISNLHALDAGNIDADVLAWLQRGFRRWQSGQAATLELALGLSDSARKAQRNRLLREAAEAMRRPDEGTWRLAGRLERAICWVQAGGAAQSREMKLIQAAIACHASRMPTSQPQLYRILSN